MRAKRILVDRSAFAVLNAEDEWGMRLADRPHTTYAFDDSVPADWRACDLVEGDESLAFEVYHPGGAFEAASPVIGQYNTANALAAMAAVYHLGIAIKDIREGPAAFPSVPKYREQILNRYGGIE